MRCTKHVFVVFIAHLLLLLIILQSFNMFLSAMYCLCDR